MVKNMKFVLKIIKISWMTLEWELKISQLDSLKTMTELLSIPFFLISDGIDATQLIKSDKT